MVDFEVDSSTGLTRIILRPNASLTESQANLLLGFLALLMGSIAAFFACFGLWLVLPFSGLEWLVFFICLKKSLKYSRITQVITIDETMVELLKHDDMSNSKYQFPRAWMKFEKVQPEIMGYPARLYFALHGRRVSLGEFLAENELLKLETELRKILILQ